MLILTLYNSKWLTGMRHHSICYSPDDNSYNHNKEEDN